VASTWGAPQGQAPPAIAREWQEEKNVEVEEKGKKTTRTERQTHSEAVKIDASRVTATLHIDYRQKGLLWFSTYKVDFDGAYTFQNPSLQEEEFAFQLPFPAQQAVYDDVQLFLDDQPLAVTFSGSEAVARARLTAGQKSVLHAAYRSQGLDCSRE
jgi:inner membrane protein involved in colicin E2 resistance